MSSVEDRIRAAKTPPHEQHELAQDDVDAPLIDLGAQLRELRRSDHEHDDRTRRGVPAHQRGELGEGELGGVVVGEHVDWSGPGASGNN